MRSVFFVLFALPLSAQHLSVPCDASRKTLLLLEGAPPLRDVSIPFERRTGALRTLAERNPEDFFIQRAYQDSFRHTYHLADEFDRALAMYRKRASDPLSRYYEARLLMYAALSKQEGWRETASKRTSQISRILAESIQREARKAKIKDIDAHAAARTLISALLNLKSTHALLDRGEKEREAVERIIHQWIQGLSLG